VRRAGAAMALAGLLTGCAQMPNGATWAVADFALYGQNYRPFPLQMMQPGLTRQLLHDNIEGGLKQMGASDVWVAQRFASVPGPDYVAERLYVRVESDMVTAWQVEPGGYATQAQIPTAWNSLEGPAGRR
jgi:hypothetical protein